MSPFLYEAQRSDITESIVHAIDEIKWEVPRNIGILLILTNNRDRHFIIESAVDRLTK